MNFSLDFPYAYGEPQQSASFKIQPEDFIVDEVFSFEPKGEGEHLYLHIKKTGENTQYLADALANFLAIKKMDIGAAGMKDRNAITTQWFSCYMPGKEIEFDAKRFIETTKLNIELLTQVRHTQKLRRGDHQGNCFQISLREIKQNDETEDRLQKIKENGVPNYFGSQRFGRESSNLEQFSAKVERELTQDHSNKKRKGSSRKGGRNTNSMLTSAARSWLFNLVLSERIRQNTWQTIIPGEVLLNDQATGPLWGRGRNQVSDEAAKLEASVLEPMRQWCNSLEHSGLSQERRVLKLSPQNLAWTWQEDSLQLTFQLKPGEYATSLLREICLLRQA